MVTTTYLEMLRREELRPSTRPCADLLVTRIDPPSGQVNRQLYIEVGSRWSWIDRLEWSREQWQTYAESQHVETWIGQVDGETAGYFELARGPERSVEIAYFGLVPAFTGKGLGGRLLTLAIERAWEIGAARVWVHTCTLDSPHALRNYQARGMQVYREELRREEGSCENG